jgi:hypothetical protein
MGGYKTQQVGDTTEFTTTPEAVPSPIGMLAIPAVLLVLISFATGIIWGILACGFVYGAAYLLMHSKQATLYRPCHHPQSRAQERGRVDCRDQSHAVSEA